MGPQRLIQLKGWCRLYTGLLDMVSKIWKNLEAEQNKEDRLDRMIRTFSLE